MSTERPSWLRRWRWPIALLVLLLVAEVFLRTYYGFYTLYDNYCFKFYF